MKTVIDVNRFVWGKVKYFATVKKLTLNSAVELLLINALKKSGYFAEKEENSINEPI